MKGNEETRKKVAARKKNRVKDMWKISQQKNDKNQPKGFADIWKEMQNMQEEDKEMMMEVKPVRLGDASIASPFTSKDPHIGSCITVITQGRCTLVTTLQMYSILAMNCLISAYSLSVLYLEGIKFGDTQMTISGIAISVCFLFITRANPVPELSAERPHTTPFTFYMLTSLAGQITVHFGVLFMSTILAKPFTPTDEETKDPEATFKPNCLNSVIFLVSTTQTVGTFAANYVGRPFTQSIRENKWLFRGMAFLMAVCVGLTVGAFKGFEEFMQIKDMPDGEFRMQLGALLVFDFVASVGWERLCRKMCRKKINKRFTEDQPA